MVYQCVSVLALLSLNVGAAAEAKSIPSSLHDVPSLAIVSSISPWVSARYEGMFSRREWGAVDPEKEINKWVVEAVPAMLNRSVKIEHGYVLGLLENNPGMATKLFEETIRAKVEELCIKWDVDAIVLVHSGSGSYGINAGSVRLPGVGVFYGQHTLSYASIVLSTYDHSSKSFRPSLELARSRELPPLDWHNSLVDYSVKERKLLFDSIYAVAAETLPVLFQRLGLAKADLSVTPLKKSFIGAVREIPLAPDHPTPEGDELKVPAGMSTEIVRVAVIAGFREREWKIASSTPERIVGVISEGNKESVETAVLGLDKVTLSGERTEVMDHGTRKKIERKERWHRNLKAEIVRELYLHSVQTDGP